jgi:hypothetical protein
MITLEQLKHACRTHDNAVDIGTPFEEVMRRRNVDAKDVAYIAQQRALRMIFEMRGQKPNDLGPTPITLTDEETVLMMKMAAAWMDGIAVGLLVESLRRGEDAT